MKDIKDYVFFCLLKDNEFSYGIKRGTCTNHELYFRAFLDIDSYLFEEEWIVENWDLSCRNMARNGNIMIVNTAVEINILEDRMYAIYLPTFPTLFQLNGLEEVLNELKTVDLDVAVYGMDEDYFKDLRMNTSFDSKKFLKRYIEYHKENLKKQTPIYFENNKVKSYV